MATIRKLRDTRRSEAQNELLDDVDRRLLQELSQDPRLSKSALARRVGVSTPTAISRIARLERLGVIRRYWLDIDPAALGWGVAGWLRVRPGLGQLSRLAEMASKTPHVTECHRVTGEDSLMIRVHARSLAEFESVLDRFLFHGETVSSIIQSSPVPPRPLPITPSPAPVTNGEADPRRLRRAHP